MSSAFYLPSKYQGSLIFHGLFFAFLAGEHVAPYVISTALKELLPEGHPIETFQGTPGLPSGCITYEERYSLVEGESNR